jgi:hypothetical protein
MKSQIGKKRKYNKNKYHFSLIYSEYNEPIIYNSQRSLAHRYSIIIDFSVIYKGHVF